MNGGHSTLQIKVLDPGSVHKISSGQVVVDLQTAVKELVENSLDAGATSIEVRFKDHGLESFEVIDNGSGIPSQDHDYIALKHHTSKLASFTDLETVTTFGFRGEALSSLCALSDALSVTTATAADAPAGTVIEFDRTGKAKAKKGKAARQRGTTVSVSGLFKPLPVRRKELERNARREHAKALALLHAYALVPCAHENHGVRLTVTNQTVQGKKTVQVRTDGTPSTRASVTAIWGPKALEHLVDLDLAFAVEVDAAVLRRLGRTRDDGDTNEVTVKGLISKFAVGCGRNGTDRQFFFVNGRPCAPSKVQKAFNEVYRSFNATQAPFVVADFILPTNSCDINVSPDKRTILLHSENNLVQALKAALEEMYAPSRSTFDVNPSQAPRKADAAPPPTQRTQAPREDEATAEQDKDKDKHPLFLPDEQAEESHPQSQHDGDDVVQSDEGADASASAFGEPALLLEPSQLRPSRALAGEEEDPGSDFEREAPESPTVTQMVNKGAIKVGLSDSEDDDAREDEDEDDDDAPRPSQRPLAKLLGARRNAALATAGHGGGEEEEEQEDAPIPSLRPPVRPVARAPESVRAKAGGSGPARGGGGGGGEQMVLSTLGASWSLRRRAEADAPGSAERARKKSRVEGREAQAGMRVLLSQFARKGSRVEEVGMDVREEEQEEDKQRDGAREVVPEETVDVEMREAAEMELSDGAVDEVEVMEEERLAMIDITEDDDSGPVRPRAKRAGRSDVGRSVVSAMSEEVIRTADRDSLTVSIDLSSLTASWKKLRERLADALRDQEDRERDAKAKLDSTAGVGNTDDEEAVEALSRVIDKPDFATMGIIGQFNLGFIIVRRLKPRAEGDGASGEEMEMDDLFIVDQHAADEKYNFETLQRTTKIESQQMISPEVLELTAADELVVLENMDVLRQNGFELDVAEDRPAGQRARMTAHPVSGTTKFDAKDLEELLHLMQDRPAGQMVRCSRARAMFAMRACRKSIMIGTALNRRQMTSVVQHMGTMDQPWHCPHGRPTMRHLSDIVGVGWDRRSGTGKRVNWAAFGRAGCTVEG
ncbi:DNA mismatch repair protein MutL [Ganoderma leucocontextum]|nr:DNA mismatch repair protein MutL [Ganoderma leucocontextum]